MSSDIWPFYREDAFRPAASKRLSFASYSGVAYRGR